MIRFRSSYRATAPAMFTGRNMDLFEMVFRGSCYDVVLHSAQGAGKPDNIAGSRTLYLGF